MTHYDMADFDDDEQLASGFDHDEAVPKKTSVDLAKEKDYTPQDYASDQIEAAQDEAFYKKQPEAENPTTIIGKEYIDVYGKTVGVTYKHNLCIIYHRIILP